jgi:hypothetical protein
MKTLLQSALRYILREYAVFHRKGTYRGYYDLKEEFQGDGAPAQTS